MFGCPSAQSPALLACLLFLQRQETVLLRYSSRRRIYTCTHVKQLATDSRPPPQTQPSACDKQTSDTDKVKGVQYEKTATQNKQQCIQPRSQPPSRRSAHSFPACSSSERERQSMCVPSLLPCSSLYTRLVNHGACVWGPRAANHICQSSLGWWGATTAGGALMFPGLYMNSISCRWMWLQG